MGMKVLIFFQVERAMDKVPCEEKPGLHKMGFFEGSKRCGVAVATIFLVDVTDVI